MKSAKQKVFSVFSIIFYSMVFYSFFLALRLQGAERRSYLGYFFVAAVCAVILGAMTTVEKERIVMAVSAATCVTGLAAFWGLCDRHPVEGPVYLISGYPILFLLVLILLLGKKKEKQKVFKIVQMVMVGLLFVNAVVNLSGDFYRFYFFDWDVLLRWALSFNSLASLFWGMWVINFMQYGKKSTDDISLENPKELPS